MVDKIFQNIAFWGALLRAAVGGGTVGSPPGVLSSLPALGPVSPDLPWLGLLSLAHSLSWPL